MSRLNLEPSVSRRKSWGPASTRVLFLILAAAPFAPAGQQVPGAAGLSPARQPVAGGRLVTLIADHPLQEGTSDLPQVEPHLAADPKDPNRLLAGSIIVSSDSEGPWHCAAFLSLDSGRSWRRHDFSMERCIDPWVLLTSGGDLLVAAIEIKRDLPGSERFRLVLFRSTDNGRTWSDPLDLGRRHDHELMIQDPNGELLLVSRLAVATGDGFPRHTIGMMRSSDGGRSFQRSGQILPGNLAQTATGLVRLSDGALIVSYIDMQRNVDGFESLGGLRQPRAWVLRSEDLGAGFSEPLFASEGCGATEGFAGYPALAVDASQSPFRDRLYHLCVQADFDGLALTVSDNRGEIWSAPQRVDLAPATGPGHVRTPMLAVNREGVVVAAWYDRRHHPERQCQDTYLAFSENGGGTFSSPVRVSTTTSCPQSPGNGRVSRSWPMGGDYGSLAASADGSFHIIWADSRPGHFQLRHAAFRVESAGAGRARKEEPQS